MSEYTYEITPEKVAEYVADCDERINATREDLNSLLLVTGNLEFNSKYQHVINSSENRIKLWTVEKMIYKALGNKNTQRKLFPKLLSKYDDLMGISYENSANLVINGFCKERDYLEECKNSLVIRENIKDMCLYGENV